MNLPTELRCLNHQQQLSATGGEASSELKCDDGCRVPVVRGIPRFVTSENYAASFGLQWNAFRKTQLDSHTGLTISRDRLAEALGDSLEVLRGKSVLEVGCGAGRFTEVMLAAGARVFACDLSRAVEANYTNCSDGPNYFVCQADARALPVHPNSFDFVICLGVLQHTPSPEEIIAALARCLKPGGMLVIDHYGPEYPYTFSRKWLRVLLLRFPAAIATSLALTVSKVLVPLHKLGWGQSEGRWHLRKCLQRVSPLIDYYEVYPQLGKKMLAEWSLLDTHDTLTDYYKHLRTVEEIDSCLISCGLVQTNCEYAGNGVQARATMPLTCNVG